VGNVLPDLLGDAAGGGRLRARHVAGTGAPDSDLVRGVRLHLATDRRFHSHPLFLSAMAEASALLRAAPFAHPPHRVFFLAHIFVEIALDAVLLVRDPDGRFADAAGHFYGQFDRADLPAVAAETETLLGRPLPDLLPSLHHFARARYLFGYATGDGLARALSRVSRRVGLTDFASDDDRARLAAVFGAYLPRAAELGPYLWQPPNAPPKHA